ncbi:MAG: AGE family epimerase/isomerase, partial [Cyanobacteria bacterium HKST-UBA05]|nr:AGE family epimerase/isomerase [Cyanobacteria bacterium HKST-UBA05]
LHQLDDSNPAIAEPARHRIEQTLTAQLQLHDPVWGGVYQYSHGGDWQHPHFEKIMKVQADNIAVYAQAGQRLNRADWIAAAERVAGYLTTFLRDPTTGGFYVSQDADVIAGHHSDAYFALDDVGRRAQGLPRVDRHQYARENGWAIEALVTLYGATGKQQYLQTALQATRFVEANRALGADQVGGFSHDAYAGQTPDTLYLGDTVYLGDTLAMGQAYLALYRATGQRAWLQKAEAAARFIDQQFRVPVPPVGSVVSSPVSSSSSSSSVHPTSLSVGYLTAASKGDGLSVIKPVPLRDENVRMARFANLLFYHSGRLDYSKMAQTAMRLIVIPKRANEPFVATTLLADAELAHPPLHMTVVGAKSDPAAAALF